MTTGTAERTGGDGQHTEKGAQEGGPRWAQGSITVKNRAEVVRFDADAGCCVGLVRPTARITLANLAYNMRRLVWIKGRTAPA